ncbi:hypothetical protein PsorP6_004688 [Peronosclerospora sorghi]|uniref:Uncharacterized protein n=1 Tax=Peronosclerospora sorghi TaxID=230839 RepID=A0ACC0VQL4_9STRA|nr:hypothetical protein PsorP6_004688 [Peronosclerospora sorghi]
MVWGPFAGSKKSKLVFMSPGRRTSVDFVEIVYDEALNDFLGEVPGGIPMEDGSSVHRSKRRKTPPKNVNEMQQALKEAWNQINEEGLAALAASTPERIVAVIKKGWTHSLV